MQREPPAGWTEVLGHHATNPAEPRTVGYPVYALGRDWTVSSCEAGIKAQFEQFTRAGAKRAIAEAASEDPQEADALRSVYLADYAAKGYTWDGKCCKTLRRTLHGLSYYWYLLLLRCHPEMTEDLGGRIFADNPADSLEAIKWSWGNSPPPPRKARGGETHDGTNGSGSQVGSELRSQTA